MTRTRLHIPRLSSLHNQHPPSRNARDDHDNVRGLKKPFSAFAVLLFLLLVFPLAAHASVVLGDANTTSLSSGLVGYWTFDGKSTHWNTNTTDDVSGNGNTGFIQSTVLGTTSAPTAGKIGQAFKFPGTATTFGISAANSSSLAITGNITMSAWVKTNGPTSTRQVIMSRWGGTNSYALALDSNISCSGGTKAEIFINPGAMCSSSSVSTGKWHLVTATYDGATEKLYIDGVLDASQAASGAIGNGGQDLHIGYESAGFGGAAFSGAMDDLRIYNRALNATEIQQLYELGTVNIAHSNTVALSSGLVGYWTFDGPTVHWGTGKVDDVSGNGNTGQMIGMSTTTSPTIGKIGQALKFVSANSQSITVPAISSLQNAPQATLSAWFKRTVVGSNVSWGADLDYTGQYRFGSEVYSDGNIYVGIGNGAVGYAYFASDDTKWHKLDVVFNGANGTNATRLVVYLDGVAQTLTFSGGAGTIPANILSTNAPFYIGRDLSTAGIGHYSDGTIDDVRIYSRALSTQQIAQLYAQGKTNIAHSNPTPTTSTLNKGLVGYWTFDGPTVHWGTGNVDDVSGQGNTGTMVGMSTTTSPTIGKIGQALSFNGSNNAVKVSSMPAVAFGTGPFTLSAWFRGTSEPTDGTILASDGEQGGNSGLLWYTQSTPGITLWPDGGITNIFDGKWHHIVQTRTGTGTNQGFVYVDGALVNTGTDSRNLVDTIFVIGEDINLQHPGKGSIDDVRIYSRALSYQEIQQLYKMGAAQ